MYSLNDLLKGKGNLLQEGKKIIPGGTTFIKTTRNVCS